MYLIPHNNFFGFLIILLFPMLSVANTIRVKKGSQYNSIQKAINSAAEYDTIIVSAGNYFEKNIIINKPLTLTGENFPVLDGESKFEIVSIKSANVTFSGFKLQHGV